MPPALRKAAILLTALDTPSADALLEQMDPRQASLVRSAVLSLGEVSPHEQQQVLEEFFRQQGRQAGSQRSADVTLELSPAADPPAGQPPADPPQRPTAAPATAPPARASPHAEDDAPPLAFLTEVDPAALAGVLQHEHPQTAAVVLAHLPPDHAAAVLKELPADLAIEALTRMASLAPLARDVLRDLAQVLQRLLAPHRTSAAALEKLSAVLAAMDQASREQVLAQLSRRQGSLARLLQENRAVSPVAGPKPPSLPVQAAPEVTAFRYRLQRPAPAVPAATPTFTALPHGLVPAPHPHADAPATNVPAPHPHVEPQGTHTKADAELPAEDAAGLDALEALAALDGRSLHDALAQLDVPTLALALLGAGGPLVTRVLGLLPPERARALRAALAQTRPVRLRDIEQAQQRCLATIRAMAVWRPPRAATAVAPA